MLRRSRKEWDHDEEVGRVLLDKPVLADPLRMDVMVAERADQHLTNDWSFFIKEGVTEPVRGTREDVGTQIPK